MTRQDVHALIDELPEEQLDSVAALIVEVVAAPDDEPLTPDERLELDDGLREARARLGRPARDVLVDLDL